MLASLERHGVPQREVALRWARHEEMPDYLSAADAGIAFIRPCLSKRSSSPTKYGEYLACGLPLVINAGIGDADALIERDGAGVLVRTFAAESYRRAAEELRRNWVRGREAFRAIAERHLSLSGLAVPCYRRLYERVLARRSRARLLVLAPYPLGCAPSQRLKFEQYYDDFEQGGFSVTASPFVCPALWRILYERGRLARKVLLTLYGYARRLRDFARAGRFDLVYVHLWAVPFGPPWFEEALVRRGIPIVYDIDDLIYLPKASQANQFLRRFRKEARISRIMRAAHHVIASTEYLRRFALRHNPAATYISSTIDTARYVPRQHSQETRRVTIGWSGSHSTSPYLHLLAPVLQELSRRFDLRLLVIGDARFRMAGVRVEARAWDRARETADLAEMDIGVYPLPDEEWVLGKSGLKALQYMGMGVPVVASRVGAVCEFIQDGENGFLAWGPDEWIERLSQLICTPALRRQMGWAGRTTVERRFSVAVTTPVYLRILREAIDGRAPERLPAGTLEVPAGTTAPTAGPEPALAWRPRST
jgi:glycosyltransferase involved in cell wall biosynthesis